MGKIQLSYVSVSSVSVLEFQVTNIRLHVRFHFYETIKLFYLSLSLSPSSVNDLRIKKYFNEWNVIIWVAYEIFISCFMINISNIMYHDNHYYSLLKINNIVHCCPLTVAPKPSIQITQSINFTVRLNRFASMDSQSYSTASKQCNTKP